VFCSSGTLSISIRGLSIHSKPPVSMASFAKETSSNEAGTPTIGPLTSELTAIDMLPSTYVAGFHDPLVVKRMRYRRLGECTDRSGVPMWVSVLGLGTSSLGNVFGVMEKSEAVRVIVEAIKAGVNFIDTAPWYGHGLAESVVGEAMSQVPREACYLFTKVGRCVRRRGIALHRIATLSIIRSFIIRLFVLSSILLSDYSCGSFLFVYDCCSRTTSAFAPNGVTNN
jgi:hypothetical protein